MHHNLKCKPAPVARKAVSLFAASTLVATLVTFLPIGRAAADVDFAAQTTPAYLTLSANHSSVVEGSQVQGGAPFFVITATLRDPAAAAIQFDLIATGGAAGTDFQAIDPISIAIGETTGTTNFAPIDDKKKGDKTITLDAEIPNTIVTPVSIEIIDNETNLLAVNTENLHVGRTSTQSYQVRLKKRPTGTINVTAKTRQVANLENNGMHGEINFSGQPTAGLVFNTSNWSAWQQVNVTGATLGSIYIDHELSSASDPELSAGVSTVGGGVLVNVYDFSESQFIEMPTKVELAEGKSAVVTVNLVDHLDRTITASSGLSIDLDYEFGHRLKASDISSMPSSLTFASGASSASFTIQAVEIAGPIVVPTSIEEVEPDTRSLIISASTSTSGWQVSKRSTLVDVVKRKRHVIMPRNVSVEEGQGAVVTVTLGEPAPTAGLTVKLSYIIGNGVEASDVSTKPSRLTFAAGATSASFTIQTVESETPAGEPKRSTRRGFIVSAFLTPPTNTDDWIVLQARRATIVTIYESEETILMPAQVDVVEGTDGVVTVALGGTAPTSPVVSIALSYEYSGFEGGIVASDLTAAPSTLTFAAGAREGSFTIETADNSEASTQRVRTFLVHATTSTSGWEVDKSFRTTIVNFIDDEAAAVDVGGGGSEDEQGDGDGDGGGGGGGGGGGAVVPIPPPVDTGDTGDTSPDTMPDPDSTTERDRHPSCEPDFEPTSLPFTDVAATSDIYADVACILALEITTGTSATTYTPEGSVTREQMGAFLSRFYATVTGETAPVTSPYPFGDVDMSSFAYEHIGRLHHLGITTGTSQPPDPPLYSPDRLVTLEQIAAFLSRIYTKVEGAPAELADTFPFTDVDQSSFAYDDISRLFRLGVIEGNDSNTYEPKSIMSRSQMAGFLARLYRALTG